MESGGGIEHCNYALVVGWVLVLSRHFIKHSFVVRHWEGETSVLWSDALCICVVS